jgi:pilus assembly protein CpaB
MRMILVILAALIVAGGTGYYVVQGLRLPAPEAVVEVEAPKLRQVFVPARELIAGTIIAPEHLSRMEMTEAAITAEMVVADAEGQTLLAGSVARQVLPQGVPIARTAIVQPGDRGFLAAVLPKGMRAISIPVTETAGLNGLALPGDWVDLILTYSVTADDDGGENSDSKPRDISASETVARNIRLLALDNRVNAQAKNEKGEIVAPPPPRTATLQVTPRQAEEITLANTLGSLSLALNSVRDGGEGAESRVEPVALTTPALGRQVAPGDLELTLDSDVTSLLRLEVQKTVPEQVARIQVVRGRGGAGLAETLPVKAEGAAEAPAGKVAAPSADPEGE